MSKFGPFEGHQAGHDRNAEAERQLRGKGLAELCPTQRFTNRLHVKQSLLPNTGDLVVAPSSARSSLPGRTRASIKRSEKDETETAVSPVIRRLGAATRMKPVIKLKAKEVVEPVLKFKRETVTRAMFRPRAKLAKDNVGPAVEIECETVATPVVRFETKTVMMPVIEFETETVVKPFDEHETKPQFIFTKERPRISPLGRRLDCASTLVATWRSPEGGAAELLWVGAKEKTGILATAFRVGVKILKYKINPLSAIFDLVKVVTDAVIKDDPGSDAKKLHDFAQAQFLSALNAGL
ncbi:hypothetical protein AB0I51_05430 [Streptomyces sp. NPDC050549]|uniref:hypothetical protein n=1 Tax=Streptomyces sp. NPDC050549 TaxID=3155406 RepID=UPI00343B4253